MTNRVGETKSINIAIKQSENVIKTQIQPQIVCFFLSICGDLIYSKGCIAFGRYSTSVTPNIDKQVNKMI